jgi:cytochrome c oxidase assembly factor CtaG
VLDSLLTVTKGSIFWMLGAIVLLVALDRAVAAATGLPLSFFLVIASGVAAALLVAGGYTIVKTLRH